MKLFILMAWCFGFWHVAKGVAADYYWSYSRTRWAHIKHGAINQSHFKLDTQWCNFLTLNRGRNQIHSTEPCRCSPLLHPSPQQQTCSCILPYSNGSYVITDILSFKYAFEQSKYLPTCWNCSGDLQVDPVSCLSLESEEVDSVSPGVYLELLLQMLFLG